jgi:hypothetical protein
MFFYVYLLNKQKQREMTTKERELFEECKMQLIHIHDVVGRKQFGSTKNVIKKIEQALTAPVDVEQREQLNTFVDWWHGLSQEELAWYEGRYVEVFLSLEQTKTT